MSVRLAATLTKASAKAQGRAQTYHVAVRHGPQHGGLEPAVHEPVVSGGVVQSRVKKTAVTARVSV
jgi:hypothetical protein